MPRHRTLSPEDMTALFLSCAEQAITGQGVKNATARNIAARAGYTAGTLYTCFKSLDDLLVQLQIIVLGRLQDELRDTLENAAPDHLMSELAEVYVKFACDNAELWELVQQNGTTNDPDLHQAYTEALQATRNLFSDGYRRQTAATGRPADNETASLLWIATHGLTNVATSKKVSFISDSEITGLATSLARKFAA